MRRKRGTQRRRDRPPCVPIALIVIVNSSHVARGRGSLYPAATATMESIDRHERIPLNAPGHPWAYLCFPRAEVQLGIERGRALSLITDISFSIPQFRAVHSLFFGEHFIYTFRKLVASVVDRSPFLPDYILQINYFLTMEINLKKEKTRVSSFSRDFFSFGRGKYSFNQ